MPQVKCPTCHKSYTLSDQLAGKRVRCKGCQTEFNVPFEDAGKVEIVGESKPRYQSRGKIADEIDYEIFGSEMQYVEIILDPGEQVVAEAGSMMFMTENIEMQAVFGDTSKSAQQSSSFWNKVTSAGKRLITGESLFMTTFTNQGSSRETVAFASPYPGKILPLHLDQLGRELICQKDAFLCGARGIEISIAFQKNIGVGLFGGEGFIMQRLRGDGIACCHAGGTVLERDLATGETLKLDTGCIVALSPKVDYQIEFVGGIKNALFGGEGLFMATLRGPGHIWLQSLPFSRFAGRVVSSTGALSRKGEGSVLDMTGLGKLFMGDRS